MNCHYNKLIIELYNKIAEAQVENIYEIPAEKLKFLYCFEYNELVAPFVRDSIQKGMSIRSTARRLRTTRRKVETICSYMK